MKRNVRYSTREAFEQALLAYKTKNDVNCFENSLLIFVTNIPCIKMREYPDVDELLNRGLEQTIGFLIKHKLHAYTIWLSDVSWSLEKLRCNYYAGN